MVSRTPWLAIVGIGEDGVEGLSPAARIAIAQAEWVYGGERHLALARSLISGERVAWPSPLTDAIPAILARRGRPVTVLASGDPFCFGIGSTLARAVAPSDMLCLPGPSAFSLACARLGWARQEVETISFCGRPLEAIRPLLQPGARVLALSADHTTPAALAALLTRWGFGETRVTVLEAIGGPDEDSFTFKASKTIHDRISPLNLMALEVAGGPAMPLSTGLDEDWFETDGQITKREIRALTLAALAPRRGERLWDVGAGSGSIGIEWMLRHTANRTIAIEARADRAARVARNAQALGVPALEVRHGAAPETLDGLAPPDAVFIGGGASNTALTDVCWAFLPSGGRLVINAVTLETERAVMACHATWGGPVDAHRHRATGADRTHAGLRACPHRAAIPGSEARGGEAGDGPAMIVAGIGCRTEVSAEAILALLGIAAQTALPDVLAVPAFRRNEPGIAAAAAALGVAILWVERSALHGEQGRCLTRSARAEAEVGLSCVAEAAALAGAGPGSRLVLPRIAGGGVTCALAEGAGA